MAFNTSQAVGPVRTAHELDSGKLFHYISQHLPHLARSASTVDVLQFKHGQSNPTYLLRVGSETMVLRKKPAGKLLASAHAVEREHQVLAALGSTSVPVPRVVLSCEDASITGTPFYLMEFVSGRIYVDPNLPNVPAQTRREIYKAAATTLANLHSIDARPVGLASYGDPNNYCRRQLQRWMRQYTASTATPTPEMLALATWLQANVPTADATPAHPTICHGDYRLDNLVLDQNNQVKAILDWELSTLGNPWADVAYSCMAYHFPSSLTVLPGLHQPLAAGIPTEQEYLAWYCSTRGVQPPSGKDWAFYLGLSFFRLASILAGVQARARQGNASSEKATQMGAQEVIDSLASTALRLVSSFQGAAPGAGPAGAACGGQGAGCAQAACACSGTACNAGSSCCTSGVPCQQGSKAGQNCGAAACGNAWCAEAGACRSVDCGSRGGAQAGCGSCCTAGGCSEGRVEELKQKLLEFMRQHVYPAEATLNAHTQSPERWTIHPLQEELKRKAKAAGLWNLWLPASLAASLQHLQALCSCPQEASILLGAGLSNEQYAGLCEIMGTSVWAPEAFNCSAPDTGNMEVLGKYGNKEQQRQWLLPLLRGDIRSCFAMTEKAVASSDATNIQSSIRRQGAGYTLDGVKWWISGATDPRCKICIFMGKTDPTGPAHKQQSMILVPMDAPGVKMVRPMMVFGFDDAPHGHAELHFVGVRVPAQNMILGEGRGFEIAQGRLGPGRMHHCMRLVGAAERAVGLMARRALERKVFGGALAKQGAFREQLAKCRIEVNAARLLVLDAARKLDREGGKGARDAIAIAKVAAPNAALKVLDAAIQAHGAAGVSQDTVLAQLWTHARTLRIADGPDEVHLLTIARMELLRASKL